MRQNLVAALLLLAASGPAMAQPRAVVELFTSQGCSSCPPADKMMGELARDPSVIALSLPVDYWDYVGWKDTLADNTFTRRQRAYSEVRGDRAVYTPQIVVDGVQHAVGSNGEEVRRAIEMAATHPSVLSVPVAISGKNGAYSISLGKSAHKGEVWVVPIETSAEVKIERGENTGKTVTYSNVVRCFRKIADYDGNAATLALKPDVTNAPGADSFAVLVQANAAGRPGAILGAALRKP
ncbi:DUF1223 domain-containing protein [Labrys portucalensis]|uniref:DUF1223 domain-containing protein n=1 Tax=Labrys neptuniae TaxID=376174 RepID=A0ABV3PIB3_9HYPH|nr:DUF1223 domain-containing protein [Labrys neptuniae]MDT3376603.1 DUF1223 domain-containing protein [Labrys neptuniae]